MKYGSVFSGIDGGAVAAEWLGWEILFHCEKEAFCQQILKESYFDAAVKNVKNAIEQNKQQTLFT